MSPGVRLYRMAPENMRNSRSSRGPSGSCQMALPRVKTRRSASGFQPSMGVVHSARTRPQSHRPDPGTTRRFPVPPRWGSVAGRGAGAVPGGGEDVDHLVAAEVAAGRGVDDGPVPGGAAAPGGGCHRPSGPGVEPAAVSAAARSPADRWVRCRNRRVRPRWSSPPVLGRLTSPVRCRVRRRRHRRRGPCSPGRRPSGA